MFCVLIMLGVCAKKISNFCQSYGILHQTIRPQTSRQNEVAEQKYHLLDVVRTLMITMNVSKYLWIDAILCACH